MGDARALLLRFRLTNQKWQTAVPLTDAQAPKTQSPASQMIKDLDLVLQLLFGEGLKLSHADSQSHTILMSGLSSQVT